MVCFIIEKEQTKLVKLLSAGKYLKLPCLGKTLAKLNIAGYVLSLNTDSQP